MSTHSHLEEALQRDIDQLRAKVTEMAGLAERALKNSVQALVVRNRRQAYSVILRDQYLDELETELDRLCLEFLVRHQPAGVHLRLVYTCIQANKELERIGDYAESIARQVLAVSDLQPQPPFTRFVELGDLAVQMLRSTLQAFLQQDADLAWRTLALEERANALRTTINADLAEWNRLGMIAPEAYQPLLTVTRRLERAADQAKNICEEVLYLCTGEFVKHKGAEGFRILFFDLTNSCLSQMAEGIANSLALERFVFSSAGAAPQPIAPEAVEFLARKHIDISKGATKNLQQLARWESYQVIVALGQRAFEALPYPPKKSILLTWPIQDPADAAGFPELQKQAFEAAYQRLEANIRELVEAILDEPKTEPKP